MVERQARDLEVRVRVLVPVQVKIFLLKCDNISLNAKLLVVHLGKPFEGYCVIFWVRMMDLLKLKCYTK